MVLFLVATGIMVVYNVKRASDYEPREDDCLSLRHDLVRQLGGGFRDLAGQRRSRPAPLDAPPAEREPRDAAERRDEPDSRPPGAPAK